MGNRNHAFFPITRTASISLGVLLSVQEQINLFAQATRDQIEALSDPSV